MPQRHLRRRKSITTKGVLCSFGISTKDEKLDLSSHNSIPKLHKCSYRQRYISGSVKYSTSYWHLFYRRSKPGFRVTVTLATLWMVWIRCGFWRTVKSIYNQGPFHRHDITEILLKVALNTITLTPIKTAQNRSLEVNLIRTYVSEPIILPNNKAMDPQPKRSCWSLVVVLRP